MIHIEYHFCWFQGDCSYKINSTKIKTYNEKKHIKKNLNINKDNIMREKGVQRVQPIHAYINYI